MQSLVLVVHVILALVVIGLVLIQHGKGADAGAAFGSGASATVFGARGSASFLTRATTVAVGLFFLTSLTLFYLAAHRDRGVNSVTDRVGVEEIVPAAESELPAAAVVDGDTLPAAAEAPAGESTSSDTTTGQEALATDTAPAVEITPAKDDTLPPPAD